MSGNFVYALVTNDAEVKYVGVTSRRKQRERQHKDNYPDCTFLLMQEYETREVAVEGERHWIERWSEEGHSLDNKNGGGNGPSPGFKLSESAKAKISKVHKGKDHNGRNNPMYGKNHSEEAKAKMSKRAKERLSNPENHPMYGKSHNEETRVKLAEAGAKGRHVRWHVDRDIVDPECEYC